MRARTRRARQDCRRLERTRCRSGRRVRWDEGLARAGDYPRTARREDRHHRMVGRAFGVRREFTFAGQGQSGAHHRHREPADGSDRQRRPAQPGDRQARAERAAGDQAGGLEHRYPQRRRNQTRSCRTDGRDDRIRRAGAAGRDSGSLGRTGGHPR